MNRRTVLGVAAIFALLFPLAIYILVFGKSRISASSTAWAEFATYVSGTVGVVAAVFNAALVLYIAVLARNWAQTDRQYSIAFDAHREWMSLEMYTARTKAYEFLKTDPVRRLDVSEKERPMDMVELWVVLGFFQRLQFLHHRKQIAQVELTDLFGQIFTWWDVVCFETQLPGIWDSDDRVAALRQVISLAAQYKHWRRLAESDRAAMVAAAPVQSERDPTG